jgi:hypothetical protein
VYIVPVNSDSGASGFAFVLRYRMEAVQSAKSVKKRRNVYMGQEYLDLEAIAVQERKRTGKDITVSDLIRKACKEYASGYWRNIATGKPD